jgi:DUF3085 family protein
MPVLIFDAADVRRVVEHSIANKQVPLIVDYDAMMQPITKPTTEPSVILVHDQGVYLMSNGTPRDLADPAIGRSFVAYARGCHPEQNLAWYDIARSLVGGDDFTECLPWAIELKRIIDGGASVVAINIDDDSISLVENADTVGKLLN